MNDGPIPQLLDILSGVGNCCLWWLWRGRGTLHQLHKIMAINLLHDPKAATAMVSDAFQVLAAPRIGLSWRGRERELQQRTQPNCSFPAPSNHNTVIANYTNTQSEPAPPGGETGVVVHNFRMVILDGLSGVR